MERVEYDEFGLFHENAEEFGLPYDGRPTVRRESVDLPDGRTISPEAVEAGVVDRRRAQRRKFHRLEDGEVSQILGG